MKKKFIKWIARIMIIITILLSGLIFLVFSKSLERKEKNTNEVIFNQMLDNISLYRDFNERQKDLFEKNYLSKAKTLSLSLNYNNYSNEYLSSLLTMLEVSSISIVNKDGIVINSSLPSKVGLSCYQNESMALFIPLIEGSSDSSVCIYNSFYLNYKVLFGFKPKNLNLGMIYFEISKERLWEYQIDNTYNSFVSNVAINENSVLFILDETGNLVTSSNQEEGYMLIEHFDTLVINNLKKVVITKINYKKGMLIIDKVDDLYIGYYTNLKPLFHDSLKYTLVINIGLVLVSLFMFYVIYKLLSFYVLNDLEIMGNKAKKFSNGSLDIVFSGGKTKEIITLNQEFEHVIELLKNRKESFTDIIAMMGKDLDAYEYHHSGNQIFYSANLLKRLNLTLAELKENVKNKYQKEIANQDKDIMYTEEDYHITGSDRMLRIKRLVRFDSIFCIIEETTEKHRETKMLKQCIKEANAKVYLDSLTGLANRRRIIEYIRHALKQKESKGMLVLLDIDNFKKINDILGHQEGDHLLIDVARLINKSFPENSIKARLGGDEFMIFINDLNLPGGLEKTLTTFLDEFRNKFKSYYEAYKLSVSIGAVVINNQPVSFEELYVEVDEAMYFSKKKGKDSFYIATLN